MSYSVNVITSSSPYKVDVNTSSTPYQVNIKVGAEVDSKKYAEEAAISATEALASEQAAAQSEINADASELSASIDAQTATEQAIIATEKSGESLASASAALISEQNAAISETNAATSASNAAASELAAEIAADSINAVLIQNLGDISGTVDIDLNIGTLIKATLTDSVTLAFTGLPNSTSEKGFTLRLSGIQMIVFPVGTLFASGDAPTPEGALYDIPCSINSSGVVIVYGSINAIEI